MDKENISWKLIDKYFKENSEILNVAIGKTLTINEMLEKTKTKMGKKFFPYSAKDNNCQRFILSMLEGNNLANKSNKDFIKQNKKLLSDIKTPLRYVSSNIVSSSVNSNLE